MRSRDGIGIARYLIIMTANSQAIIDELHTLPEWTADAVRAVMARHDSELIDLFPSSFIPRSVPSSTPALSAGPMSQGLIGCLRY